MLVCKHTDGPSSSVKAWTLKQKVQRNDAPASYICLWSPAPAPIVLNHHPIQWQQLFLLAITCGLLYFPSASGASLHGVFTRGLVWAIAGHLGSVSAGIVWNIGLFQVLGKIKERDDNLFKRWCYVSDLPSCIFSNTLQDCNIDQSQQGYNRNLEQKSIYICGSKQQGIYFNAQPWPWMTKWHATLCTPLSPFTCMLLSWFCIMTYM